jgi:hypothetical protein
MAKDWHQDLEESARQRLEMTAELMAQEQRLDELEKKHAQLTPHPDPLVQSLVDRAQLQLRNNHLSDVAVHQLREHIGLMQGALLALIERVQDLERRLES